MISLLENLNGIKPILNSELYKQGGLATLNYKIGDKAIHYF